MPLKHRTGNKTHTNHVETLVEDVCMYVGMYLMYV